jgi:hypothetical protein
MADLCRSLALARSSKTAYAGHRRIFSDFCSTLGFDEFSLSESELALAVAHFACGHSVNSAAGYLSALQNYWTAAGAGTLPRGPAFNLFFRGLKRLLGTADEVVHTTALSIKDLGILVAGLDKSNPDHVCFGAECIAGSFLALRTEDHVDGRLRWGDIYPQAPTSAG